MVPEIWSVWWTELSFWTIFFPFIPLNNPKNENFLKIKKTTGDIISHMRTINDNHMMYGSWGIDHDGDHFWSFYPPNNPKNQNFEKMKYISGDIIILNKCTTNDNHMIYGSWDMKRDRQNILSFWTVFLPFYPPNKKSKFLKTEKEHWRYHHFTQVHQKSWSYHIIP